MKRLKPLTFKQLRAIEAIDKTSSFAAAAEVMSLTAPAVHSQIKALEENFGCAMIYRTGSKKFTLTPEGRTLLNAYIRCASELEKAVREIEGISQGLKGVVVLGVVSTGKYFAPRLVASLKKHFPDIEVVLKDGNRQEIISALQSNAIDLAIMGRPPREPAVSATRIGDHPHILIAQPDSHLTQLSHISPDDLFRETMILREEGSGTRILGTRILDRIGEGRTYDRIEMGSNESIKQAVIAGLGIAIISRHTVTEELNTGRLVELNMPEFPVLRTWYVLHRVDSELTAAALQILGYIVEKKSSILPN